MDHILDHRGDLMSVNVKIVEKFSISINLRWVMLLRIILYIHN